MNNLFSEVRKTDEEHLLKKSSLRSHTMKSVKMGLIIGLKTKLKEEQPRN